MRALSSLNSWDINEPKKSFFKEIAYPFNRFSNSDIEGTKGCLRKFNTKRKTNPLNPQYKLQPIGEIDYYVPKFLKDPLEVDDIKGTKTKKKIKEKEIRKTNYIGDIEFARPAKEKKFEKVRNIMETQDINCKQMMNQTNNRNPLNPEYLIKSEVDRSYIKIGPI